MVNEIVDKGEEEEGEGKRPEILVLEGQSTDSG